VLVPKAEERARIHEIIYDELVVGRVSDEARRDAAAIVASLAKRGAEGVIEGCTEITLLDLGERTDLPRFDTTRIHAEAAIDWALSGRSG
jgi:aspartate racemase